VRPEDAGSRCRPRSCPSLVEPRPPRKLHGPEPLVHALPHGRTVLRVGRYPGAELGTAAAPGKADLMIVPTLNGL
jgi:hypothetical protein